MSAEGSEQNKSETASLFILKGASESLVAAETFLRNRGWQVASSTNLREALAYIIQRQPEFVMVTADHSNRKVRMLPKLLVQAFPVKIIAFAEKQQPNSIKAMNEMGCENTLFPPVSGPAIDRLVRKMKRDQEVQKEQKAHLNLSRDASKQMTDHDEPSLRFSDASGARAALSKFLSNDSGGSSTVMREQRQMSYGHGQGSKEQVGYIPPGGFKSDSKFTNLAQMMGTDANRRQDESFDQWAERMREFARKNPQSQVNPDDPQFLNQIQAAQANYVAPGGFQAGSAFAKLGEALGEDADQYDDETYDQWAARMKDFAKQNPHLGINPDHPDFAEQLAAALTDPHRKNQKSSPGVYVAKGKGLGRGIGYMGQPNYVAPGGFRKGSPFAKLGEKMGDDANMNEEESFEHWADRIRNYARKNPFQGIDPEAKDFNHQLREAQANYDSSAGWDGLQGRNANEHGYENDSADSIRDQGYSPDQQSSNKNQNGYTSDNANDPAVSYSDNDPQIQTRKAKKTPVYKYGDPTNGSSKEDALIIRGTQTALDESVILTEEGRIVNEVTKSSNVACITVDSPRFKGYLVCAMGKNRKVDQSLMKMIQDKLFAFMKANGEEFSTEDTLSLKIQEVEFESWAFHQAEFLRKSIHDGDEIAIAFFPTKTLDANLSDSASQKMLKLDVNDLKPDKPIEFDLYMYMPENNKYILYTPQGMVIYANQLDRLKAKGVGHMHLRKEAVHDVKKYKAQNFLNDKIASYQTARKEAKENRKLNQSKS